MTKGSLKLRLAAIVRTGSKQQNKAPKRIIFPICGSTGNRAKCTPSGVSSSCLSKAFCHKKKKKHKVITAVWRMQLTVVWSDMKVIVQITNRNIQQIQEKGNHL